MWLFHLFLSSSTKRVSTPPCLVKGSKYRLHDVSNYYRVSQQNALLCLTGHRGHREWTINNKQKYLGWVLKLPLTVVPPTAKARKSVRDVMVMAAPALLMVSPNLSVIGRVSSSSFRLLKHCIVTNMSSIPELLSEFYFWHSDVLNLWFILLKGSLLLWCHIYNLLDKWFVQYSI